MPTPLPSAVAAFISTTNNGDTERFLALFAEHASLNDWGREYTGRDGVAEWNETDNIGRRAHFTVLSASRLEGADSWRLELRVSGGGFNGASPMLFDLADQKIVRVVIPRT